MSRVIFLHGASSSGKTTLAGAIRAASSTPWVHLSLDHFRDSGAVDRANLTGEARARMFDGLHRSFAAFSDAGNDLIVEHILDEPRWIARLTSAFANHDVLFVGVHAKRTNLIAREKQRGDRELGSAARDDKIVHQGRHYDLDIQSEDGVEANVIRIMAAMEKTRNSDFSA